MPLGFGWGWCWLCLGLVLVRAVAVAVVVVVVVTVVVVAVAAVVVAAVVAVVAIRSYLGHLGHLKLFQAMPMCIRILSIPKRRRASAHQQLKLSSHPPRKRHSRMSAYVCATWPWASPHSSTP